MSETANVVTQQEARDKYVFITALCWPSPVSSTALKLGQNNQRNTVPKKIIQLRLLLFYVTLDYTDHGEKIRCVS